MSNPHDVNLTDLVAADANDFMPTCPKCGGRRLYALLHHDFVAGTIEIKSTTITLDCHDCGAVGEGGTFEAALQQIKSAFESK